MVRGMTTATTLEPTQVRLLDAAERLIGARGVEGVSLRAINTEAGSNVAAAHYHFGSKEGLVRAVLDRRMAVLAEERYELLAPLEHEATPSPRQVAEVFAVPLLDLSRAGAGMDYVRFLSALDRSGGEWLHLLDQAFAPQLTRLLPVLARATPDLGADRGILRLGVAGATLLHMLASADRYSGQLDADEYRDEVVGTITSILTGPSAR
jgi:AcrR family transcriptional regulator